MRAISLKLPEQLLARLEKASRARRTTKSSLVRECLEKQLPETKPQTGHPKLPPGESFYDKALPILKKPGRNADAARGIWPPIPNTWKASVNDRPRGHRRARGAD